MNRGADITVFKRTFSAVAVGKNDKSVRTGRRFFRKLIHFFVIYCARVVLEPAVEDTCAVETQKHTIPGFIAGMINMHKCINS